MKILYHHRTRGGDAQGIHIRAMIHGFRELGHEVRVAGMVGEESLAAPGKEEGTKGRNNSLAYEFMTLAYNLYGLGMLAKGILRFRPDMIYERYSLNTCCGVLISRISGIPLVLEVNAPLSYEQKKYGRLAFPSLATRLERWICSGSRATIVVSKVMRDMLRDIGVPGDRMTVMHNGIDPEEFRPDIPGDAVRSRWGIGKKVVLGFTGWFKQWHGLEMLVDLFARERWGERGVHLLLVGDGPAMGNLSSRVQELDLLRDVTFTGPVPREEMPRYVSAFDVALQPSVTEYASPMKIFEYMGMAKCIVAPDQPNIREILTDGKTGILFRPGDPEDLKRAISRALGSMEDRERIGKSAHQAIFENGYLWRKNAERAIGLAFDGNPVR